MRSRQDLGHALSLTDGGRAASDVARKAWGDWGCALARRAQWPNARTGRVAATAGPRPSLGGGRRGKGEDSRS